MNEFITADIIIAGCILIIGMAIGVVCIRGIKAGENRGLAGIITTTAEGDLCGLPGAVETEGLGIIKKPPCRKGQDKAQMAAEIITGELPPTPKRPPERPVFKIKACCLICARGIPKDGIVLCSYSKEESIESWYCKRFLLRDLDEDEYRT